MHEKTSFVLILLVILVFITSCAVPENKVLNSLGSYQKHEFYTEGIFQDYTDYTKYYFDSVDFSGNHYFVQIQETDLPEINEHIDDFEVLIDTYRNSDCSREIVKKYDFDREIIDCGDYFLLILRDTHGMTVILHS